ncbi:PAS domain-containing sensor histidine kinase [Paludibacterium paludis]|uniref:Two-component sensor n=1 Tax=Paludibacterium paludis TaxID=1225769 RepID=A0A918P4N8_9NEIS|nr:transporter substrate-binding domain-containing protein [Paludibacterium paludis]GGY22342.1 two-component sensor [Paludibacterium paludis]
MILTTPSEERIIAVFLFVRHAVVLIALLLVPAFVCANGESAGKHDHWRVGIVLEPPYAGINPQTRALEGADVELVKLVAERWPVSITWRTYPSRAELDAALLRGDVDIAPGLQQTPSALRFWLFSEPYLRVPHKIVGLPDASGRIVDLETLPLSSRLALPAGGGVMSFMERNYPELWRVAAGTERMALLAVMRRDADYAIIDEARLATLLKEPEFSPLAVVGDVGYTHLLRIAVRKDWPELPPLLDARLQSLPSARLDNIAERWLRPGHPPVTDSPLFWRRLCYGLFALAFGAGIMALRQRRGRLALESRLLAERQEGREREVAEESLRLAQYSIDNSTVGILWVNWEGCIRYANRAVHQMLGYDGRQMRNLPLAALEPDLTPARWLARWNALRGHATEQYGESRCRKADGHWLPVGVHQGFLRFGREEYLVVYLSDITERLRARAELEESEARFKSIAANVPGMVFRLERNHEAQPRLAFVSDASQALLGVAPSAMIGAEDGIRRAVHPDDRASFDAAWRRAADEAADLDWQGRMDGADGTVWADIKARARHLGNGHVIWDGILWDMSASKRSEIELAESRGLLRRLSAHLESVREEEKARIAREVHDELGQILTVLRLEMSMCELSLKPGKHGLTERFAVMKKLIEQTFLIVRDVASALRPPVLDAGIGSAIAWQARRFEGRSGIPCYVTVPETLASLPDAHAIGLFRILQEALTNVLRHAQASMVSIGLRSERGRLTLSIADDGKGFDPEAHSPERSFGLVGIRERVLLLGGSLSIESQPGQGTVLSVSIPVEEDMKETG